MDARAVTMWSRRLPHWEIAEGTYFVTVHCNDSLPQSVLEEVRHCAAEDNSKRELFRRLERYLDRGLGECPLRSAESSRAVLDALRSFDPLRLRLLAASVMPNHLHTVLQTAPGETLRKIMKSIKGFTAWSVNKVLGRKGQLWQDEYFDALVTDQNRLDRVVRYIEENPLKAGLDPEVRVLVLARMYLSRWRV